MYLINMRLLKSMCGDGCLALIQNDLLPRQAVLGFEERQLFQHLQHQKTSAPAGRIARAGCIIPTICQPEGLHLPDCG